MSHRAIITEQFQAALDHASAEGLCRLYTDYNVREPLLDGIARGDAFLWRSEAVRLLIVATMQNAKAANHRPKMLQKENRDFAILCELHYLKGLGVPVYAEKRTDEPDGCTIVAARHHVQPSTAKDIWKNSDRTHALFSAAEKAGRRARGE